MNANDKIRCGEKNRMTDLPASRYCTLSNDRLGVIRNAYGFVTVLLLELLHQDGLLLVLTAFILEPDPYDSRTQARHFHQLLLHQGVGSRVRVVARPEGVELLFIQHRPYASGFLRLLMDVISMGCLSNRYWIC